MGLVVEGKVVMEGKEDLSWWERVRVGFMFIVVERGG